MGHSRLKLVVFTAVMLATIGRDVSVRAEVTKQEVQLAIERGRRHLTKRQNADGSWSTGSMGQYQVGVSALCVLALINSGMTANDREVKLGLDYLRSQNPDTTYNISVLVMALAAAKDGIRDRARLERFVNKLEQFQTQNAGDDTGSWPYTLGGPHRDRSNAQFAVLALWEAQQAGVRVNPETWKLADQQFRSSGVRGGGWNYSNQSPHAGSTGSMTVAGIATLSITGTMIRLNEEQMNENGTFKCCTQQTADAELEAGISWLGKNFSVHHNPGERNGWYLYYMYGLERAGRLSGRRFFESGNQRHDWYREGAEMFVRTQLLQDGSWNGVGMMENESVIATSYALLFLSKGLAPVLINKLNYGPPDDSLWNKHRDDVRNLTQLITGLPKWPKLLNWQVVEFDKAEINDLLQAPVLFFNGSEPLNFTDKQVALLRDYVAQGGFIFAEQTCVQDSQFDKTFRELIKRMYPEGDVKLTRLTAEHPVYRSEYLIDSGTTPLWGAEVGCRTSIIYSPNDYSCLWDKWTSFTLPKRTAQAVAMITKATNVGVNVIAYATGREPASKLEAPTVIVNEGLQDKIQRGQLQVAKMRHTGDWNVAPMALRNLLAALNRTVGMVANTKVRELAINDPNLSVYPLIYIHGRQAFQLSEPERENLQKYFKNSGVMFADACCGSKTFDKSFREEVAKLFPNHKLQRIPVTHELFKSTFGGHDLPKVKRREIDTSQTDKPLDPVIREVEPFLEGIEIDGRYVLVYSRYDISCALERQNATTCAGYLQDDAVRLAVNIVIYLMH